MCTVAVFGDDEGGLWLVGNRDEAYWRSAAEPPEVRDGVAIWPRDPDGGGTWTAVNQFGVALSLLNNYQGTTGQARDPISRGQIIVQLAQAEDLDEVAAGLDALDFQRFEPFLLLAASRDGDVQVLEQRWDGQRASRERHHGALMRTSAAFDFETAELWRRDQWRRSPLSQHSRTSPRSSISQALEGFFTAHHPTSGALSVCKHTPIASTVSHTQIRVGGDHVWMRHVPNAPCGAAAGVEVVLARQPR